MTWDELQMTDFERLTHFLKTTDNWQRLQVQDFDTHKFGNIIVCYLDDSMVPKIKSLCNNDNNIYIEPFGNLHLDYSTTLTSYYLESNPNNIKHMSSLI